MLLTSTSDIVRLVTSSNADVDVHVSWADITSTTFTPGRTNTAISSAANTTIVSSPGASTQRQIKFISVKNKDATDGNIVTIQLYDGSIYAEIYKYTLAAGDSIEYDGSKWRPFNSSGVPLIYNDIETEFSILIEDLGTGTTYSGKASAGSLSSDAVWQVKKIVESGGDLTITFADGDTNFDNVWDDRASLTYS